MVTESSRTANDEILEPGEIALAKKHTHDKIYRSAIRPSYDRCVFNCVQWLMDSCRHAKVNRFLGQIFQRPHLLLGIDSELHQYPAVNKHPETVKFRELTSRVDKL